jgi:hypothetical protein
MQPKNLMILGSVTVAALAVAALALRNPDEASSKIGNTRLFPALGDHLNDVTEVCVEKGGKSATLKREGGKWKLTDRGGYPVQFEKVKELATGIADLQIEEQKTAKKSNHAQLGLEWPPKAKEAKEGEGKDGKAEADESSGDEQTEASLVTLKDASGRTWRALVVGKSEWRGSKSKIYARRLSEDQVYLCAPRGTLSVMPDAKNWIEPKFVELANDRVQSVEIDHADGEVVEIGRSAENHTQFTVQNLPPGKNEKYAGVANGVAQALGYGLQLEDVRPVTEVDFTKEPLAKSHFKSVDGLELVLETCKFEDKTFVRVSASYTPPPEPPKTETPPAEDAASGEKPAGDKPADADKDKAAADKPTEEKKDVGKEAADMNERLAPWAFEVGSYRIDVLARHMKDLIAEPAPPAAEGSAAGLVGPGSLGTIREMAAAEGRRSPQPKKEEE